MRSSLALALFLVTLGALPPLTASVHAQDEAAPMVLVVEGAAGRLSVLRLRRALSSVLARPVVRLTDAEAATAPLRLTIAFAAPRSWTLVLEGTGRTTRTLEIRGPALETLVGVSVDLVRAAESPPVATADTTSGATGSPSSLAQPWSSRIAIASEILDPFAGMPLSRVAIAAVSDLLDPFAAVGTTVRVARSPEVLDPWR